MWTVLKVFIEFVTIFFLFSVLFFFGQEACGIFVPQTGIRPTHPAFEAEALTSGLLGKSPTPSMPLFSLPPARSAGFA